MLMSPHLAAINRFADKFHIYSYQDFPMHSMTRTASISEEPGKSH